MKETAFQNSKDMLKSAEVLVHYNTALHLVVACDASPYGIGAVLSHLMGDGEERPIAYALWSPTPAENYSQLDKEALAVVFATRKFHMYLYGQRFRLYTDHKPLLGLFGPKRAILQMASARMQRWILSMASLEYDLHYCTGSENANADRLSQLPLPTAPVEVQVPGEVVFLMELVYFMLDITQIRQQTQRDPALSWVFQYV